MSISTDPDKYKSKPVEQYLSEKSHLGSRTYDLYEEALYRFREFIEENYSDVGDQGHPILQIDQHPIFDYRDHLLEEYPEPYVKDQLGYISTFYSHLKKENAVEANPASYVLSESDLSDYSSDRPEISLREMRGFVNDLTYPFDEALFLLLLKYGPRVGEVCNIDLSCLNLSHSGYQREYIQEYGIELHEEIENRPDSLYFYEDIDAGDVINGEQRGNYQMNKRKMGTIVPIDEELKTALLRWLAIRPDIRDRNAHPLFMTTTYNRYKSNVLSGYISNKLDEYRPGWRPAEGRDTTQNVTGHYFRHYFDTNHREGHNKYHDGELSDILIKYIRGDVLDGGDSDILEDYTHDWSLNIREPYLDNVYNFRRYK